MELIEQLSELLPILPPFRIERVEKDEPGQTVHLYLSVDKSSKPDGSLIHSYYDRSWEHLRLFQYRRLIHCRLPVYKDKQTGQPTKANVTFSREYSRFTLACEREVMRLMRIHHCLSAVARQLGVNLRRVESIYHRYTHQLECDTITSTPVNIAFDETSTRKGHEYVTTFFDLDTRRVIGVYDGKSADCVRQFMQDHPCPQAVRNISVDMSPAFVSGVRSCLGQALVTFDKWHVVRLLHRHLEKPGDRAAGLASHIRLLMEDVADFYQRTKADQLRAQLMFVADLALDTLGHNPITRTIRDHFEGIANYAGSRINNGVLEGLNPKIQVIRRVARGFRYKSNFKKMIRFVFLDEQHPIIS